MTSDWLFARTLADPAATQTPPEAAGEAWSEAEPAVCALPSPEGKLMELLFAGGDQVRLSELTLSQRRQLNEVADLLLAEAEQRHWFRRLTPLADAGLRLAGPALFLAGAAVIGLLGRPWLGGGLILAGVIFWVLTQGLPNPPVTADGYALRVQALGFRRYLDGTERSGRGSESSADQVRYLPFAMVFGAVESWRERLAQAVGSSSPDGFGWLAPLAPDGRLLAADGALPRLVEDLNHHLVTARLISDTLAGAGSAVAGEPVAEGGSPLARFAQRNQP